MRRIIYGLLVSFFAVFILCQWVPGLLEHLQASRAALAAGLFWTPLTCMFIHYNTLHIAANSICLYSFRDMFDQTFRKASHLVLFLLGAGILSSLLQIAVVSLPVAGASGAICGALGYLTWAYPNLRVSVLFVVPMRARHFTYAFIAFCIVCQVGHFIPFIGHMAHLSGTLFGIAFYYLYRPTGGPVPRRPLPAT